MNNKILIGVIVLVIVVVAAIMYGGKSTTNQNQPTPTQVSDQVKEVKEENVELTAQGFVPQAITIKAGTKVVWTNKSGGVATVNSAPHPTHTDYLPLNLGQFEDGSSVELVFDKPGTYRYHDHLNPTRFGSVTVE